MSAALFLTALSLAAPSAPGDAPMRLLTEHGVDMVADEQVFLLFAALNAAGYAEEPKRRGPPLNAPVFHPIREDVRDALRKVADRSSIVAVRKVFESHPQTLSVYLEAVLSQAPDAPKAKGKAAKLASSLSELSKFRTAAGLEEIFDKLAAAQRAHMKELKAIVEKDFSAARKLLGDPGFRAPTALVVVPNPLDGHDLVRKVSLGGTTYLVVGPGLDAARTAILEAALEPTIRALVDKSYRRGRKLARSWAALKSSKRITSKWPTGEAYLTSALLDGLAHRSKSKVDGTGGSERDEAFIDNEARHGMRWSRVALRIIDSHGSGSLADALPNLLGRASP